MPDFQNLILPQSSEHIILLNILFLITLLVFVGYLAILWGNTIILLVSRFISPERFQNKNTIPIISGFMREKRLFAYLLAIFPQFALATIFIQLLSESHIQNYPLFMWAALFLFIGQFFYFRHQNYVDNQKLETPTISLGLVVISLVSITLAAWFVFAAFEGVIDLANGVEPNSYIYLLSINVFIKILTFAALSISIAAAFSVYKLSHLENLKDSDRFLGVSLLAKITLANLIMLPVWGTIAFFTFPVEVLSANLFLLLGIALALSIVLAVQYFVLTNRPSQKLAFSAFVLFLITLVPVFGADHIVIYNATSEARDKLLVKAEMMELGKKEEANLVISEEDLFVQGEKVYNTICFACHQYDKKIVGPPYKEVLPKYVNDHAAMKAFILNPHRVNEDYPPMPAQPLKPQEADAVVVYLLKRLEKESAK